MFFDDENNILRLAREHMMCDFVLHFNGNSLNKKIHRCLLDESGLISDNGHDAMPPDFYSISHNMMFDVLRINDSEIKKSYNPVKIRERDISNEICKKFSDICVSGGKTMVASESSNVCEHTYMNYIKNGKRVIESHIKKISLWLQKCPNIKYKGLFVFDETEVYYRGVSMPSGYSEPDRSWVRCVDLGYGLHKPWLDEKLIRWVYESELDFVIWFCPYKPYGIARQANCKFPCLVIIDTRFPFNDYRDYSDDLVC